MRLLTATAALAFLLAGCDATQPGTDPAAPTVIAPDAFAFEPGFPSGSGLAEKTAGENFNNAAFRVGVVTGVIGANLVLPSAATRAATRAEPVVEDGVWIWENTVRVAGDDVTLRLEGEPEGREVDWRLGITTDDLHDFTLYTARTDLDGQTGDWQLFYDEDGERTEVLRADFEVTDAGTREITFSIPPGRDAAGSSVLYVHDEDRRVFDWDQEPEGFRHLVEWDGSTGTGFIEADNFRSGERACWDASRADVACVSA